MSKFFSICKIFFIYCFLFAESPRSLHVCNAPSPAATSAIPIGNYICEKVRDKITN